MELRAGRRRPAACRCVLLLSPPDVPPTWRLCRVGVIGAGANTKLHHIPNLQRIPGVRLVTVCNRTLGSARAAAEQFGIPG